MQSNGDRWRRRLKFLDLLPGQDVSPHADYRSLSESDSMTVFCVLFANVANGEQPIIISDILLTEGLRYSADGKRYEKTYIPSLGGTFPQVSPDASIAGLIQKTYVLDNGHCVALAGDFEIVADFYSDIASKTDLVDIAKAVKRYQDALQFVVLMHDAEAEQIYLCATASCRKLTPGSYGMVLIGGSGHTTLRKLLIAHQQRPMVGDSTLKNLSRALILVNEALDMDESDPAETLGERFGAYYEITAFTGSRFVKIGDVAHHYLTVNFVDGVTHWVLKKSYYHEYLGNNLIIRRVTWGRDNEQSVVWQDCYAIGSLRGTANIPEVSHRIRDTAPMPTLEVLCVRIGKSSFRTVLEQRHLVKIRREESKWYPDIDQVVLDEIANSIADGLDAVRTLQLPGSPQ